MRYWLAFLVWCFCHAGLVNLTVGQLSEFTPAPSTKYEETYQKLEQTISVDYNQTKFSTVLKDLESALDVQFFVDESAEDNSLDDEMSIIFSLDDVRASTILELMLRPYDCTYHIQDGVVLILSRDASYDELTRYVISHHRSDLSIEQLQIVIQEIIDPDSWEMNGGTARIMEYGSQLVVTQTDTNIREIRDLLFVLDNVK